MDIFERKPYQEFMHDSQDKKLNRVLGAFDITIMGLGIIIGTGIFVLTGIGAAKYAGPGLLYWRLLLVPSYVWLIRNWLPFCPYQEALILMLMRL